MKFVVFGLAISSSWGNGHATLWRGLCRALHLRGHRVVFFERDVPYYAAHRDLVALPGCELVLYESWSAIADRAHRELLDADVGMITSYCPDATDATDLLLDAPRALPVFYDLDTPVTLSRLGDGEAVPYISSHGLAPFPLVLSYTGGEALDGLRALGARKAAPLYGHVDPDVHRPGSPSSEFACDLAYLGTYADDRQVALDELLLQPAREQPNRRFVIAGAQYPANFPWTSNIYFVRHLAPAQHPDFYASCRLTLNVTRQAMARMGWCPSGRLFEAAACGAAILSDTWDGLDAFFTPGVEILVARTSDDALAALDMGEAGLKRLRDAARERVLRDHTSEARARELEMLVDAAMSGRRTATSRPAIAVA